ncbi:MAG TPA: type II CAAX endopeptidase family protein [Rhizomicrobium sp.]
MSGMAAPTDKNVHKSLREVWLFLALTFAISWGLGAAYLLFPGTAALFGPMNATSAGFYIVGYAPTISAVTLSLAFGGFAGLKSLLARLVQPFRLAWLFVAALTFPLIALLLAAAMPLLDLHWPVRFHSILVTLPLVLFTTGQIVVNTGPLGEELGWRGYALPRLLERWNVVVCGLILGFFWTVWHIPAFFVPGAMAMSFANFGWWALDTFALSVFMAWLFVRAGGNIVIAGMIPHFVINGMGRVGAWVSRPEEAMSIALLMLVVFLVTGTGRRKREV